MNIPVIQGKKIRKKFDRTFKQQPVEFWLNRGKDAAEMALSRWAFLPNG